MGSHEEEGDSTITLEIKALRVDLDQTHRRIKHLKDRRQYRREKLKLELRYPHWGRRRSLI